MSELECPGLPADWLNAWFAAVGATILVPEMYLSWTEDSPPRAVFSMNGPHDPLESLASAWPNAERFAEMAIARKLGDLPELKRHVPVTTFRARAAHGRPSRDCWTLTSTMTDLFVTDRDPHKAMVSHSRLDPPAPSGMTLHQRLCRLAAAIDDLVKTGDHIGVRVGDALAGRGGRIEDNGLGWDIKRLTARGDESQPMTDPFIEILAFFGLAIVPVRSDGLVARRGASSESSPVRSRCWHALPGERGHRMCWPAWLMPLRRFAIDALLDSWVPRQRRDWKLLGVHAGWASVEYMGRGQGDPTKGIGSEALR